MAVERGSDAGTPGTGRDYFRLVMALLCVSAVGVAGMTYDSTLNSDPDEIIDVKHEWLPIGKDKIKDFKDPQSSANDASSGGGGGSDVKTPCTGGFISFLANLFPTLIPPCGPFYLLGLLMPFLLLVAGSALAYRYRRRLAAPALIVQALLAKLPGTHHEPGGSDWPHRDPANDIDRAWLTMVERANLEKPWTQTPGECARAAVDAGLEFEAVNKITQLFVKVRYAGVPLSNDRQQEARYWRDRLGDGTDQHLANGSGHQRTDGGRSPHGDNGGHRHTDDDSRHRTHSGGEYP